METRTLLPAGDALNALTLILGIGSALLFLLTTAALLRWRVPETWFGSLIVVSVVLSISLQVIWFTRWAVLPFLVNLALLWVIFGQHVTVENLRV